MELAEQALALSGNGQCEVLGTGYEDVVLHAEFKRVVLGSECCILVEGGPGRRPVT